jgi:hypothetical protein
MIKSELLKDTLCD